MSGMNFLRKKTVDKDVEKEERYENTEKEKEIYRTEYLFPVNVIGMIQGEKDKAIKIFLNQLDLKFDDIINSYPNNREEFLTTKKELRQVFLDSINGLARFSNGLLKGYVSHGDFLDRVVNAIKEK